MDRFLSYGKNAEHETVRKQDAKRPHCIPTRSMGTRNKEAWEREIKKHGNEK
ncbi:Uncharacterized protein dnm_081840 [Desulfonema magnum]|uniref:Uncharacterized protein n=1 Tax=Desulfonema magnum TaxID=45655 RepID=A0A975BVR2_9BACT|nr:Uncharacterized protein dnm_081840 [Desulfonema magnum]